MGFYNERGSTVRIVGTRQVETQVRVRHVEMEDVTIPGEWVRTRVWLDGHYETQKYYVPEMSELKKRIVPEHYEKRTETVAAHWGTREYWLSPHTEIRYRFVGTSEQRAGRAGWEIVDGEHVFVGTSAQRAGRAGWESYEVEIPGCWEDRRVWFPETTRTYTVFVPEKSEHYREVIPAYYEDREVWIDGREIERAVQRPDVVTQVEKEWFTWETKMVDDPIFEKIFDEDFEKYELVSADQAVWRIAGHDVDKITIRNIETGIAYDWECEFVGYATRTGDNTYVVPVED